MRKSPDIGRYLDEEEKGLAEATEAEGTAFDSVLTPLRREEIEAMARAAIDDDSSEVLVRLPKADLIRLQSKARREGIPYQALIGALIRKYVAQS